MPFVGDHDIAVLFGDAFLVASNIGGDPEQQAGIAGFAGRQSADGMCHQKCAAQTAHVAMRHDAGSHHRLEHRVMIVAKVERNGSDPHCRADTRGRLTAAAGGNSTLQVDQDLPETPADSSVGTQERPFGRRQRQVKFGQPLLLDPAMINQDIAERQAPAACRRNRALSIAIDRAFVSRPERRRRNSSPDRSVS